MNTVAEILLQLVKLIADAVGLRLNLGADNREQRDRIATLLDSIGFCIGDIARSLSEEAAQCLNSETERSNWETRWARVSKCEELDLYLERLREVLSKSIFSDDQVQLLLDHLLLARAGPHNALALIDENPGYLLFKINTKPTPTVGSINEDKEYQRQMEETGVSSPGTIESLREDLRTRLTIEIDTIAAASGKLHGAAAMIRAIEKGKITRLFSEYRT